MPINYDPQQHPILRAVRGKVETMDTGLEMLYVALRGGRLVMWTEQACSDCESVRERLQRCQAHADVLYAAIQLQLL